MMKVVALVSGGKDSVYSMLQCVRHGHEVVALANLAPTDEACLELDSWMFQTVGHTAVSALAAAMQLPLFRRTTDGVARRRALAYAEACPGDEVEDLCALLAEVRARMPEVAAVCSGAVLSNYQRLRVEHVCQRLGLRSLAFLWQREQRALLTEMVESGVDAIMVKTAGLGLVPRLHLGRRIADLRPYLCGLQDKWGCSACGEGGEYESFTLDCPLFHARIVVDEWSVEGDAAGRDAAVAWLDLKRIHLEPKDPAARAAELARALAMELPAASFHVPLSPSLPLGCLDAPPEEGEAKVDGPAAPRSWGAVSGAALTGPDGYGRVLCSAASGDGASAELAFEDLFARAGAALSALGLRWADVFLCHAFVRDLGEYDAFNRVYARLHSVHPPARAALQLVREGAEAPRAAVELLGRRAPRESLHVQSVSEWAPCNIGPYSQAAQLQGVVHLAGQIGLEPASMTLPPPAALPQQLLQALRNSAQVLSVLSSSLDRLLSAVVYAAPSRPALLQAGACLADLWTRTCGTAHAPPTLCVQAARLPRDAVVEVQLAATQTVLDAVAAPARWHERGSAAGSWLSGAGVGHCVCALVACADQQEGSAPLDAVRAVAAAARARLAAAELADDAAVVFARLFVGPRTQALVGAEDALACVRAELGWRGDAPVCALAAAGLCAVREEGAALRCSEHDVALHLLAVHAARLDASLAAASVHVRADAGERAGE